MNQSFHAGQIHPFHFSLLLLFISIPLISFAQPLDFNVADSIAKSSNDPLIAADTYSKAWSYDKAIKVLESYGEQNADILWRLARSRTDLGENLDGEAALLHYETAMFEAEQAVTMEPSNAMAHQTLAVACGRVALYKGIFKSIGLAKKVYKHASIAVSLDPTLAVSYSVLGRTHMKLSEKPGFVRKAIGCGWASEDSVTIYFDKTLEADNNLIQTRVTYAEFLLDNSGDKEKAKAMLTEAVSLAMLDEQDLKDVNKAKDILAKLK